MMLLFEIKKVLSKPLNKAALLILTAVLVIGSVLAIRDVRYVQITLKRNASSATAERLFHF